MASPLINTVGWVPCKTRLHTLKTQHRAYALARFYFGYLAWEWPTNRLLQYFPLGKYSAFNIIMWGVVLALFAAVDNFSGAIAVRFFLGLFEAAVTPGKAASLLLQSRQLMTHGRLCLVHQPMVYQEGARAEDRNLVQFQWRCTGTTVYSTIWKPY